VEEWHLAKPAYTIRGPVDKIAWCVHLGELVEIKSACRKVPNERKIHLYRCLLTGEIIVARGVCPACDKFALAGNSAS